MKKFATMWAAISCAVMVQPAQAQSLPPMKVLIENLDADAAACGVTEAVINAAVQSSARYNRLQITDDSKYYIYVNVNVMPVGNNCVSGRNVEIFTYGPADFNGAERNSKISFCSRGGIGSSPKGAGTARLQEHLKQLIELCLSDI